MNGKGDKRRPGRNYGEHWGNIKFKGGGENVTDTDLIEKADKAIKNGCASIKWDSLYGESREGEFVVVDFTPLRADPESTYKTVKTTWPTLRGAVQHIGSLSYETPTVHPSRLCNDISNGRLCGRHEGHKVKGGPMVEVED